MENGQKPAFANMPSHTDPANTISEYGGLTKREYFAAQILSNIACSFVEDAHIETNVEFAIKYADELLKQLEHE